MLAPGKLRADVIEFMQRYFELHPAAKLARRNDQYWKPFRAEFFVPEYEESHQRCRQEFAMGEENEPVRLLATEVVNSGVYVTATAINMFSSLERYHLCQTGSGWRIIGIYRHCVFCDGSAVDDVSGKHCSRCHGCGWVPTSATRRSGVNFE